MAEDAATSVGDRIYRIREALGARPKDPMPQVEFAALATVMAKRLGIEVAYSGPKISKIEDGLRAVPIEEIPIFAALDPLKRGREWLAWDAPGELSAEYFDRTKAHELKPSELEAMKRERAARGRKGRRGTA